MQGHSEASGNRFRRLKGRTTRSQSIGTKLTLDEEKEILAASEARGQGPSEWTRDTILAAARGQRKASDDLPLFVEVQSLRLLLINALEPLLRGDKLTPDQFKELLQYVKANKRKAAKEMLASYAEVVTEEP